MTSIYISYSHDSSEHVQRVRHLSDRLRQDGVDCRIDQYAPIPSQGWARWATEEIEAADYVLVVCSEVYQKRFEGREDSGNEAGAKWEGVLIQQELFSSNLVNRRFVPVVLDQSDKSFVPRILRTYTTFSVEQEQGYKNLLLYLIGGAEQSLASVVEGNSSSNKEVMSPSLFISHSSVDSDIASRLAEDLRAHKVNVYLPSELADQGEMTNQLLRALESVDLVVTLLTPHSVGSRWIKVETMFALERLANDPSFRLIPVLAGGLRPAEIPPFLTHMKYADLGESANYSDAIEPILLILRIGSGKEPHLSLRKPKVAAKKKDRSVLTGQFLAGLGLSAAAAVTAKAQQYGSIAKYLEENSDIFSWTILTLFVIAYLAQVIVKYLTRGSIGFRELPARGASVHPVLEARDAVGAVLEARLLELSAEQPSIVKEDST